MWSCKASSTEIARIFGEEIFNPAAAINLAEMQRQGIAGRRKMEHYSKQ
jgi:hypothetical protein